MKYTRQTIQAFLSLQATSGENSPDLEELVVQLAVTTHAILFVYDLEEKLCIFLNKHIYDSLGCDPNPLEDIRTDLLTRLMHPEDLQMSPSILQFHSISDDDVISSEYRLRHANGHWRWFSSRSVVFRRNSNGVPTQILATAEDVTEQRLAEEALQLKAAQLQAVLDTAVDAILTIDEKGTIESFNHAAVLMFGYAAEEVIGQNVKMLMPAPFHEEHDSYLQHYQETGERKIIGIGREVEGRRKNGSTLELDLAVSEAWVGRRVFTGILRDITEKNQAREAILEQADLIEHAHDAILVRDLEGRIIFWNNGAVEMYGWSKEEAAGQYKHLLLKTQFPISREAMAQELMDSGRWVGELIHSRRDGVQLKVASRQMMPRDSKGRPRAVLEINIDITVQKQTQALLEESESRLRLAIENAGLGLWDWDLISNKMLYDDHWKEILGFSPDELDERQLTGDTRIHPEDREQTFQALKHHLESEESPFDMEYRTRHKSGEWVWLNARGKVSSRSGDGKPLRMIGTIQDITMRKVAQEQIRESEARFRVLADSAPVLIWTSGTDSLYDYFNQPWLKFTGRPEEMEVGNGWLDGVHPDDLSHCVEIFRSSFEMRQPFLMEYRLCRHDGQYRWLMDTGTPRLSPDGTFLGFIGSCIDITDQKNLQEQYFESQKMESMGRLAGGIAHDFNNLLTAILGFTDLTMTMLPDKSDVRPFLNNVTAAAERAAELTKQLLMYARRQMVEFGVVDINSTITNMDPLLRRTIGEQYELVISLMNDSCCVHANASQMEQVLTNLVVNARDSMPEGGRILIETSCIFLDAEYAEKHIAVVPGEYVIYSVSDNGSGMTKEVRERIFEPFYTTKEIGKGTGLGLATCYGIIKQSKGNIWVYSEPGEGTIFKVYLPRVHDKARVESVLIQDNLPAGTETILLVDDEPMVRDIASRTLRNYGYRVLEASNGAEALHLQGEWPGSIDLLVTDVVMPLMGGKELAQRLQSLNPKLTVMYMSGYTQNVVLQQGVLKEGVVMLIKPFNSASLLRTVREVLGDT